MSKNNHQDKYDANNFSGFFAGLLFVAGLLLGALAGAGAMLLLAPQSGKKTRRQIQRKGKNLRKQTDKAMDDAVSQARAKAHQVTKNMHGQAENLQQRGQDILDEGKDRLSVVVEAGKTAVHGS